MSIEESLAQRCQNKTLLRIDEGLNTVANAPHYLGVDHVKRWWINSTLRWAGTDITHVTSNQLAGAMALAFADDKWVVPPSNLLDIGHQWAMVAEGSIADTFVFPWVSLLQCFPTMATLLHLPSSSGLTLPWLDTSLAEVTDEVLQILRVREAEIIELRFGLKNERRHTLEEVGNLFGVSRERIRQIEVKALRKLRHPTRNRHFWRGFAADFVRSGGSLLHLESRTTPMQSLWTVIIGLDGELIEQLEVRIITKFELSKYRDTLLDENLRTTDRLRHLATLLPFLSKSDSETLRAIEDDYWSNRIKKHWKRPRMILEALRKLGRAAHYQEIAELCNQLFPENQTSTHSWHSALNLPSCDALGIVWIGRKGMYGLKEHGYSRPEMDLFNTVAQIVEEMFEKTQQPVAEEVVISEIGKYRREAKIGSIKMALSFNNKIENVSPTLYVPKGSKSSTKKGARSPGYDIAAAFRAFSASEDKDL